MTEAFFKASEQIQCAQMNLDNLKTAIPAIKEHHFVKIVEMQLAEALKIIEGKSEGGGIVKTKEDLYAEFAINATFDDLERKNRILIAALKAISDPEMRPYKLEEFRILAREALKKVGQE